MDKIKEGLYKKSLGIKKFVVLEFSKYQLKTYARTKKNKEKAESLKTWYYLDDKTQKEQNKKRVSGIITTGMKRSFCKMRIAVSRSQTAPTGRMRVQVNNTGRINYSVRPAEYSKCVKRLFGDLNSCEIG